jgi:hypothetical protein
LNVCGIKNRVNFPDFVELISKYDVFCCTECKIISYDELCIDNYTFLKQPRKQAFLRRSGGLGFFVKDELLKYVEVIESKSDYVFWIKLKNDVFNLSRYLVTGKVYIHQSRLIIINLMSC